MKQKDKKNNMKKPRITIIPIKDGYKWRIKRYTGKPFEDNFEGIFEFSTALEAAQSLVRYLEKWEKIWETQERG
jgi:hypothetical protein